MAIVFPKKTEENEKKGYGFILTVHGNLEADRGTSKNVKELQPPQPPTGATPDEV